MEEQYWALNTALRHPRNIDHRATYTIQLHRLRPFTQKVTQDCQNWATNSSIPQLKQQSKVTDPIESSIKIQLH